MNAVSRISKWLFFLLLLPGIIGLGVWQGWLWWSWATAPAAAETEAAVAADDRTLQVQIPEGTSAQQIGEDLKAVGLIRSTAAWDLWTRWRMLGDRQGGYLAGTYELSPDTPMTEIADQIWQGQIVESSFTVPEGWSLQQMADYFEAQGFFSAEEFLAVARQVPRSRYPWLPDTLPHLEGFLYPDTYRVAGEVTPQSVVNQMLDRFEQVALPIYQQGRSQTSYTLLQWVTLASIVEKEAVISAERPQIASVFARRLQEGIPLGADPTVEYALNVQQTPENPLTLAQVNTPSPYNTYLNAGLPPTPIASPGLSSLEASLDPAETEFLYFVARYDGTHVFSRTLAEHEAAQIVIRDGVDNRAGNSPATAN
ncbi:endolytic transglycosylase MltG [Oculatella sp. LEGE 06141]|uniref:endolytic transglycosylase MltG n=1 Tax=Oculatella sp. LEGE 06141 TaxID=1828648 RepID=UPI00187E6970|nr:endolytic transglycosylase MltG [Oculatella sp. LEGE 06141]MBE9180716.1 endolytic transglycosylase MltG [Oculatella sp. LEGE 06141]